MRISLTADSFINPYYLYANIEFSHPCNLGNFTDNYGLRYPLSQAVVGGRSDQTILDRFNVTLPVLDVIDCGVQLVSVVEPESAYKSGPVSETVSVSAYDPNIEGFYVRVNTDDPLVGQERILKMRFFV